MNRWTLYLLICIYGYACSVGNTVIAVMMSMIIVMCVRYFEESIERPFISMIMKARELGPNNWVQTLSKSEQRAFDKINDLCDK